MTRPGAREKMHTLTIFVQLLQMATPVRARRFFPFSCLERCSHGGLSAVMKLTKMFCGECELRSFVPSEETLRQT